MNLKDIYIKIKEIFFNLSSYFRRVRTLPHSGKYAALSVILIIIFTIITFPYGYLIKKMIYDNEGNGYRSVSIRELDFNITGESYAENFDAILNNGNELYCKSIILNLSLNPYRLFIRKQYMADLQFDGIRFSTGDTDVLMNLNGNIDLIIDASKKIPKQGELKLIIEDAKIRLNEMTIPGPMGPFPLQLDTINIQNGIAEIDIVNSVAKIRNLKLSGTDINCSITGTVELSERMDNSKLNLLINIDPDSSVLDQYKDMITLITKNGPFIISLQGTAGRPDVKIAEGGKTE